VYAADLAQRLRAASERASSVDVSADESVRDASNPQTLAEIKTEVPDHHPRVTR
jgi:hypothetical protein